MGLPKDNKPDLNTGRRRDPLCPVEAGGRCRRLSPDSALRSPAEELPRLALIQRLVLADAHRCGVYLDRAEIRTVIEMNDKINELTEVKP